MVVPTDVIRFRRSPIHFFRKLALNLDRIKRRVIFYSRNSNITLEMTKFDNQRLTILWFICSLILFWIKCIFEYKNGSMEFLLPILYLILWLWKLSSVSITFICWKNILLLKLLYYYIIVVLYVIVHFCAFIVCIVLHWSWNKATTLT